MYLHRHAGHDDQHLLVVLRKRFLQRVRRRNIVAHQLLLRVLKLRTLFQSFPEMDPEETQPKARDIAEPPAPGCSVFGFEDVVGDGLGGVAL